MRSGPAGVKLYPAPSSRWPGAVRKQNIGGANTVWLSVVQNANGVSAGGCGELTDCVADINCREEMNKTKGKGF